MNIGEIANKVCLLKALVFLDILILELNHLRKMNWDEFLNSQSRKSFEKKKARKYDYIIK